MKFNGTIFSKPQQDQLKENIGNELEKVSAKVDEVDARMLNYKGDWVSGDEYHENDVVTWADGHLYEVIKAHTSSDTLKPDNTEYYKAMTSTKLQKHSFNVSNKPETTSFVNYITAHETDIAFITDSNGFIYKDIRNYNDGQVSMSKIYCTYDGYGNVHQLVISTILAKTNYTTPHQRLHTINADGTITVGENSAISGVFNIYSY